MTNFNHIKLKMRNWRSDHKLQKERHLRGVAASLCLVVTVKMVRIKMIDNKHMGGPRIPTVRIYLVLKL